MDYKGLAPSAEDSAPSFRVFRRLGRSRQNSTAQGNPFAKGQAFAARVCAKLDSARQSICQGVCHAKYGVFQLKWLADSKTIPWPFSRPIACGSISLPMALPPWSWMFRTE